MSLEREGAAGNAPALERPLGGSALGLPPLHDLPSVDLRRDALALHEDVVVEPLVVLGGRLRHVLHGVKAAGLPRVLEAVRADLALEAFVRPALVLERGV